VIKSIVESVSLIGVQLPIAIDEAGNIISGRRVTDGMAKDVIDFLEPVKVDA
jgi:hypothetical protein